MKRFVLIGLVPLVAAGCGDNNTGTETPIDARSIDAATDAAPDAPPDAPPPPPFSGTFSLLEIGALAPMASGNVIFAQGIQIGIGFSDPAVAVAPAFDSSPGSPLGCKVFVYDTPAELATLNGVNEGAVMVTVDNPAGGPTDPVFPTCIFVPGAGYVCPDLGSSQTPGATTTSISATDSVTLTTMAAGQTALMTVTAASVTFGPEDVGRYVKFTGTGVASLDASFNAFPIVGIAGQKIAVLALPLPAATTIPVMQGVYSTLAGVGPQPSLADPGQLADDATVTVNFVGNAAGGGNHLGTFMIPWTGDGVGNDFSLDDTNANLLRNIPRDGTAFTLTGGATGTATAGGVVLNIVTTDTPIPAGSGHTTFPGATAKRVNLRCASLGTNAVTVPAGASAFLTPTMSSATRIQATFVRATLGVPNPPPMGSVVPIAGHAIVGFTTPPANP